MFSLKSNILSGLKPRLFQSSIKTLVVTSLLFNLVITSRTFTMASTSTSTLTSRQINLKVHSIEQGEGHGARVRRSIGRPELRNFDPFLMLDEFRVGRPAGFPDHPHRGFETVTYMLPDTKGAFAHEDFAGHSGIIEGGDLQWMTAGRGILHSEMPANNEISHGLQLWINLKSTDKMIKPAYQELKKKDIPVVTKDGVTAIVIAGTALGTTSKVYTRTPTHYLHFKMEPNTILHQPIPEGWNSFLYTIDGEILVGDDTKIIEPHYTVTLTNTKGQNGVTIKSNSKGANFVLLAGEPINEPIVQHGPFVMNTRKEIEQAFVDYQYGRNGFEGAHEFRSKIGRSITDQYHDDL